MPLLLVGLIALVLALSIAPFLIRWSLAVDVSTGKVPAGASATSGVTSAISSALAPAGTVAPWVLLAGLAIGALVLLDD
jgi:hypothetical protein